LPSGLRGGTTWEYAFTGRFVVVKVGEVERTLVILITSIDVNSPCSVLNHMGSPPTEPCMVVGRTEKSARSFSKTWSEAWGTPAARSAAFTDVTRTWTLLTPNIFSVKTKASAL